MESTKSLQSKPSHNQTANENGIQTNHEGNGRPTHEEIAQLAERIYVQSGRQAGRDAENWLQAEQILRQQYNKQASASASPKAGRKPEARNQRRSNGGPAA